MTTSRVALSQERILEAAVLIADTEGLDAVTMRRLAAALGAHPTSLYHHCPSKDAILDGIVATLVSEMVLPPAVADARDWLTGLAAGMRRVARAHPGAFLVLTRRPVVTVAALRNTEAALGALTRAGLPLAVAADAVSAVSLAVLGVALNECPPLTPLPTVADRHDLGDYPLLQGAAAATAGAGNDGVWELALDMLGRGLDLLVATRLSGRAS